MNALRPCSVTCDAMIPWSMARCEDCERNMDRSGTDPVPRNLTTTDDFDRQCECYQITCLYHLTHIENLQSIRNHGLLSHNRAHDRTDPRDIADPEVIAIRSRRRDTVFDRPLHDYVPLYFTPRNPMLSRRREIQSKLAILCINKSALLFDGAVFTDGNAAGVDTRFFGDCRHLDQLDWACIRAPYWNDFPDGKRKRCAEVLVPDRLGPEQFNGVIVSNAAAEKAVHEVLPSGLPVHNDSTWFF